VPIFRAKILIFASLKRHKGRTKRQASACNSAIRTFS
jgi:hypothetical protein